MLLQNKNKNTTCQKIWVATTSVFGGKISAVNAYITKEDFKLHKIPS